MLARDFNKLTAVLLKTIWKQLLATLKLPNSLTQNNERLVAREVIVRIVYWDYEGHIIKTNVDTGTEPGKQSQICKLFNINK